MKRTLTITAIAALSTFAALPLHAGLFITEVAPWGSASTTPYAADWFELTNTGTSAISISNWKMDDNSNAFGSAVPMNGISSIAPGESVIFMETTLASTITSFRNTWFGGSTSVQIGMYSGSGVGLSTATDAVNVFDSSGTNLARVDFGAATNFQTFENPTDLNNVTLTALSTVGVNGAFAAPGDSTQTEIGSPGTAVPEPSTGVALVSGLAGLVGFRRRRA